MNLEDSKLIKEQEVKVFNLMEECCYAPSVLDKIGTCPWVELYLRLCDQPPCFVCPFVTKGEQKQVIEKDINCQEKLGITKMELTGYISPAILVKKTIPEFVQTM